MRPSLPTSTLVVSFVTASCIHCLPAPYPTTSDVQEQTMIRSNGHPTPLASRQMATYGQNALSHLGTAGARFAVAPTLPLTTVGAHFVASGKVLAAVGKGKEASRHESKKMKLGMGLIGYPIINNILPPVVLPAASVVASVHHAGLALKNGALALYHGKGAVTKHTYDEVRHRPSEALKTIYRVPKWIANDPQISVENAVKRYSHKNEERWGSQPLVFWDERVEGFKRKLQKLRRRQQPLKVFTAPHV